MDPSLPFHDDDEEIELLEEVDDLFDNSENKWEDSEWLDDILNKG